MGGRRGLRARVGLAALGAVVAALLAPPASATWSLVAVDGETREVGVAIASCIGGVARTIRVAPGRGVVAAQAWTSFRGRDRAAEMLAAGASAEAVLDAVANADYDRWSLPLFELRQYGVAALAGAAAARAFTGGSTTDWKGDRQGEAVSVQGNMLRGAAVVDDALAAFRAAAAAGRPLAERLLAGLEAGAAAGGDWRCSRARAALSALLLVARPGDDPTAPWLELSSPDGEPADFGTIARQQLVQWWKRRSDGFDAAPLAPGEVSPVRDLRRRYEAWLRTAAQASR